MDTLTHALSGALIGRATARSGPHALPLRWRIAAGFLAAAFPDSDIIIAAFAPDDYLALHRGVTHSLLLLPLWAVLLSLVFAALTRGRYSWRAFLGISLLGIAAHIAADVITSFGTMVFAPLSDRRLAWPTTFIIDLYFSGILVAGLVASAWWRRTRAPAIVALAVLAAYIGFQATQRERALGIGEQYARAQALTGVTVRAFPQPLSPFNWMVVVSDRDRYRFAYVNLHRDTDPTPPAPGAGFLARLGADYDPPALAAWHTVQRFGPPGYAQVVAEDAWRAPAFWRYRDFSLLPVLFGVDTRRGTCVWFYDLRFSLPERVAGLRYGACRSAPDAPWQLARPRH